MVAPFEADAQLAYLNKIGYVDAVVSEDSDMLMFGSLKLMTKLGLDYRFKTIQMDEILGSKASPFHNWDHDNIVKCCTLAGCDYLQTLKGIAVKKAIKMFESLGHIEAVFRDLRARREEFAEDIDFSDFRERFERAYLSFKYQKIWCPNKLKMVSLNPLPMSIIHAKLASSAGQLPTEHEMFKAKGATYDAYLLMKFAKIKDGFAFLGTELPKEQAQLIISCKMNPITKEMFPDTLDNFPFKVDWNELTFEELQNLGFQKLAQEGAAMKRPTSTVNEIRLRVLSMSKHPEDSDQEEPAPVEVVDTPRTTCFDIAPHLFGEDESEESIPLRAINYKKKDKCKSRQMANHQSVSGLQAAKHEFEEEHRTKRIREILDEKKKIILERSAQKAAAEKG